MKKKIIMIFALVRAVVFNANRFFALGGTEIRSCRILKNPSKYGATTLDGYMGNWYNRYVYQ